MVAPRLSVGASDPVSYTCTCSARETGGGIVLLFYRYFDNAPVLPDGLHPSIDQVSTVAAWHEEITLRLGITGKIRVAKEGFNVTVGGTKAAIEDYINACVSHWSFAGLDLSTFQNRRKFFKPSSGCRCVFHPATTCSVRVCGEITPLGITNYSPTSWNIVEELEPEEFHRRTKEENVELWDLRNHYESRIGFFVDGQGQQAVMPQIRRFSQLPRLVKSGTLAGDTSASSKQVLTYCTGGIRCEKATRWIAEQDPEKRSICTLKGGIQAYLDWIDDEVEAGRKDAVDSLFKGRNYVFDSRGSVAMRHAETAVPVSQCHICGEPEDRLSKCSSRGCHLVLVVCVRCEDTSPKCCRSCASMDVGEAVDAPAIRLKIMCDCEQNREASLWNKEKPRDQKQQGWRKAKKKAEAATSIE